MQTTRCGMEVDFGQNKLVITTATFVEGSKNNFSSFINGQSSTNPAHFVKVGLVDVEIIGLTEITKEYNKE